MIDTITKNFERFHNCKEELAAKTISNRFRDFLLNKSLVFFSEYTDHSFKHCEDILRTCVDLIPDHSTEIITAKDQLFLTASILAHDTGMHINEDFFLFLIKDENWKICNSIDKFSWKKIWLEYLSEAKRWDSRKLIKMFGEAEPISIPSNDKLNFTLKERLLIGEFLRRHHGRLSHEICINGFPLFGNNQITFFQTLDNFSDKEKDLIGLMARSHTLPLRDCFSYLEEKFHLREFSQIHTIYLMVLLRISDYLQIQPSRASLIESQLKRIRSPFSSTEWKIHQSIQNITFATEDPESIYIDSLPENVNVYIKTQQWLEGIQNELDNSWAILGEVYGRFDNLNKLGLRLRRINSSLDNLEILKNKVEYVPKKVSFSSSNPDILKLLIDPLYGDNPTYGIRELLQNSIDAILEKDQYLIDNPKLILSQYQKEYDIEIAIHEDDSGLPFKVLISDNGIGMTPEIIINYFLNAGASFRKSLAWKKSYQTPEGRSKILRSGRFGIGVLACFLIGEEIEVETKHIEEDLGVKFNCGIDSDLIELKYVNCDIGTRISIIIDDSKKQKIKSWINEGYSNDEWDWFTLKYPRVKRVSYPKKKTYDQEFITPYKNITNDTNWNWIDVDGYDKIFWTFKPEFPKLICNGIKIEKINYFNDYIFSIRAFNIISPSVSVFDPNGLLPLNLERNQLKNSELPFKQELLKAIICKAYNKIEENIPVSYSSSCLKLLENKLMKDQGIEHQEPYRYNAKRLQYSAFLLKNNGFLLFTENMIFKSRIKSISLIPSEYINFDFKISNRDAIASIVVPLSNESERDLTRVCIDLSGTYSAKYGLLSSLPVIGRISIIPLRFYNFHFLEGKSISKKVLPYLKEINRNDHYMLIEIGDVVYENSPIIDLFNSMKNNKIDKPICGTQLFLSEENGISSKIEFNSLEQNWIDRFKHSIVEYKNSKSIQ